MVQDTALHRGRQQIGMGMGEANMIRSLKSAERVLEVLEYFSCVGNTGLRIKDIERDLKYPQSSCSVLLHRLVDLGYLRYVPQNRKFFPTLRIDFIGESLFGKSTEGKESMSFLEELFEETEHLCFIAQRNGADLQYVAFRRPRKWGGAVPPVGLRRPLTVAASGKVILAFLPQSEVLGVLRRNNAEGVGEVGCPAVGVLMSDLDDIRDERVAKSDPKFTPGLVGFATWLEGKDREVPYAIGVAVPADSSNCRNEQAIRALLEVNRRSGMGTAQTVSGQVGLH